MPKNIPNEIRKKIIVSLDEGKSAEKIERELPVSSRTVRRIQKQLRPTIKKSSGGRPAKLSATTKHHITRMISSGKVETATKAAKQLKTDGIADVSSSTVQRALKKEGMKAIKKKKKPKLTSRHKRLRMEFARRYQEWTVEDWKRVIWSDETKINRLGSDGLQWAWKKPGAPLQDHHVTGTVKFGGGSLMMWGCMTAKGVGYACKIDGRMDAELYKSILEDDLLQTLEYYDLEPSEIIFQQDNDPKHTSKLAKKWFTDNEIELLEWPPQSPDLNPIEHMWQHLKVQLASRQEEPKSIHELWEHVEAEWNAIPVDVCVKLIESMPKRVAEVIRAKGGNTKY
jgi:transposase